MITGIRQVTESTHNLIETARISASIFQLISLLSRESKAYLTITAGLGIKFYKPA
jgi:hypothetical protein